MGCRRRALEHTNVTPAGSAHKLHLWVPPLHSAQHSRAGRLAEQSGQSGGSGRSWCAFLPQPVHADCKGLSCLLVFGCMDGQMGCWRCLPGHCNSSPEPSCCTVPADIQLQYTLKAACHSMP